MSKKKEKKGGGGSDVSLSSDIDFHTNNIICKLFKSKHSIQFEFQGQSYQECKFIIWFQNIWNLISHELNLQLLVVSVLFTKK